MPTPARLLIIEDQPEIRHLIRMTLDAEGYEMQEAGDGESGLRIAEAWRPRFVLVDVMMPGPVDGHQVCRRLKASPSTRQCRVILITAQNRQADREAGLAAGADVFMTKPFSPAQLVARLEELAAG